MNRTQHRQLRYVMNQLYSHLFQPLGYIRKAQEFRLYQDDGLEKEIYFQVEDDCIINITVSIWEHNIYLQGERSFWDIFEDKERVERELEEMEMYIKNNILPWFSFFSTKDKMIELILNQEIEVGLDGRSVKSLAASGYRRELLWYMENNQDITYFYRRLINKIEFSLEQEMDKFSLTKDCIVERDAHLQPSSMICDTVQIKRGVAQRSYKEYLTLRVDNATLDSHKEKWQYAREWMQSRKIGCDSQGWAVLDLDSPNIPELMEDIYNSPEELQFIGWQFLQRIESGDAEWYLLKPRELQLAEYDTCIGKKVGSKVQIQAKKIPQGSHIVRDGCFEKYEDEYSRKERPLDLILCSDTFRKACEKHHLTGIVFQWAEDVSNYEAEQFFIPFFTHSMGIEIGHPYIDKKKMVKRHKEDKEDSINIHTIRNVNVNEILDKILRNQDAVHQCIFGRIAEDSKEWGMCIESFPRFLQDALPNTDFASYIRQDGELEIYVSKRAYQCLKEEGVLDVQEIETGVEICDKLPKNAVTHVSGTRKDLNDWEEVFRSFRDNMQEYQAFMEKPKRKRTVSKEEVLDYIKKLKKSDKDRCSNCAPKRWRTKLQGILPDELMEFYEITNRCRLSLSHNTIVDIVLDPIETTEIESIEDRTKEYQKDMEKEEDLLEEYKQAGISYQNGWIFAEKNSGGIQFIYIDGKVICLTWGVKSTIYQIWNSLHEFLWDVL